MKAKDLDKLEELFDEHPISNKLFILPGTEENEFPSVEIQGNFDNYNDLDFFPEFPYFDFPLENYLIDRYFGEKHSFLKGKVMVCFTLPYSLPLTIVRTSEERFELSFYNQTLADQFVEYAYLSVSEASFDIYDEKTKQNFLSARRAFLDKIFSFRPSLLNLQIGEKKTVFMPSNYFFSTDTDEKSKSQITCLLDQLFDNDEFISYYFSVLYPYLLAYAIDLVKEELSKAESILKSL